MGVLEDLPPGADHLDLAVVLLTALRVPQVIDVVAHREGELVGDQPLAHQIGRPSPTPPSGPCHRARDR